MHSEPHPDEPCISPLRRRSIEVRIAAAFHRAATDLVGPPAADEILSAAVAALADNAAATITDGRSLSLAELWDVWQELGADGRLELHLDTLDDTALSFHVDRCSYASMYREMGLERLGIAFSCRRDKPFAEALVPGVRIEQSPTLLEGAPRCEFNYTLEEDR